MSGGATASLRRTVSMDMSEMAEGEPIFNIAFRSLHELGQTVNSLLHGQKNKIDLSALKSL